MTIYFLNQTSKTLSKTKCFLNLNVGKDLIMHLYPLEFLCPISPTSFFILLYMVVLGIFSEYPKFFLDMTVKLKQLQKTRELKVLSSQSIVSFQNNRLSLQIPPWNTFHSHCNLSLCCSSFKIGLSWGLEQSSRVGVKENSLGRWKYSSSAPSDTTATRYLWLLSTWSVASVADKLNFNPS